jgi:hypothetical protein
MEKYDGITPPTKARRFAGAGQRRGVKSDERI